MASATTSFTLNPVGEGYKKTATGDERELLSEGELLTYRRSIAMCIVCVVQMISIFLWNCAHSPEGGLS